MFNTRLYGGNISENVIQSRDIAHSALPAVNYRYPYAAGGLFGFPAIGNFLPVFAGPESTSLADIPTFATQPTVELQGWAIQQPPGSRLGLRLWPLLSSSVGFEFRQVSS